MSHDAIKNSLNQKWNSLGRTSELDLKNFEISFYKKWLDLVQVGEIYYFTFVPALARIDWVSDSICQILGYKPEEFNIDFLLDHLHPDDVLTFARFEEYVVQFKKTLSPEKLLKYKTRYQLRIRHANGTYIPILHQSITIQLDENGNILRNLIIHTDLSNFVDAEHLKSTLSFIGLEGEPSFHHLQNNLALTNQNEIFSTREKEILRLVAEGYTSEQIAEKLNRSIFTIRNHRKNILQKSGCRNVSELLVKAIKEAWI